jgi:hypothetical protein
MSATVDKFTRSKLPKDVLAQYLALLEPTDVALAKDLAHTWLKSQPEWDTTSLSEAWMRGTLNVLLMRGLLKPIPKGDSV